MQPNLERIKLVKNFSLFFDYVIFLKITIGVLTLLGNRYLHTVLARSKMVMNSFGNKNFRQTMRRLNMHLRGIQGLGGGIFFFLGFGGGVREGPFFFLFQCVPLKFPRDSHQVKFSKCWPKMFPKYSTRGSQQHLSFIPYALATLQLLCIYTIRRRRGEVRGILTMFVFMHIECKN